MHTGIKGQVKNKKGVPIYGAKISVQDKGQLVYTGLDGYYWKLLPQESTYTITVSAPGYRSKTRVSRESDIMSALYSFIPYMIQLVSMGHETPFIHLFMLLIQLSELISPFCDVFFFPAVCCRFL